MRGMIEKRFKLALILMIVSAIFISPIAFASFEVGNESSNIETSYSPGERLSGWINISLDDIGGNEKFIIDELGDIEIKDFLDKNEAEYGCFPSDCERRYRAYNPEEDKSFSLGYSPDNQGKTEKTIGLNLEGDIDSISSFGFEMDVTNSEVCGSPVQIDFLGDGENIWRPGKDTITYEYSCDYDDGTGCFDHTLDDYKKGVIRDTPTCQKIKLVDSESFELGAYISGKDERWDNGDEDFYLKMELWSTEGVEKANCKIEEEPVEEGEKVSCEINYSNRESQEYYVCVRSNQGSGITDYRIEKENRGEICGFEGDPSEGTKYHDNYHIFAKGSKFGNVGRVELYDDELELAESIEDFVRIKYDNDCGEGCGVPIDFEISFYLWSADINLHNLRFFYESPGSEEHNEFYDIDEEPVEISSGFLKLDLEKAEIDVPEEYGNHTIALKLAGEEIFEGVISVEERPIIGNLWPRQGISAGEETTFEIDVTSPANNSLVKYSWDFGDNTTKTTDMREVTHTYETIDESYTIGVNVEDSEGLSSSKEFEIVVGSPEEVINDIKNKHIKNLEKVRDEGMQGMEEWEKEIVKDRLKWEDLYNEIWALKDRYQDEDEDDELIEIMKRLNEMVIPVQIEKFEDSMEFFIDYGDIRPSYFEDMGAGSLDADASKYREAISGWGYQNLDKNLQFSEVSVFYEKGKKFEPVTNLYSLSIDPEEEKDEVFYLVIEGQNIELSGDYETVDLSGAVGIKFDKIGREEIKFASDTSMYDLVLYSSPDLEKLEVVSEPKGRIGPPETRYGWAILGVISVLTFGLISYLIVLLWYRKHYENHLFKSKNNIYNIMQFIKNAENNGMKDGAIKTKLKEVGWTGEQISYSFKKYEGKPIMPLDIISLFQKIRKKSGERKGGPKPSTPSPNMR